MLRYVFLLLCAGIANAADAPAEDPVKSALDACAAMNTRFVDTECSATRVRTQEYQVTIKAGTPDAMRVVFMRSLDVADLLCNAGNKVALRQELMTSGGPKAVLWTLAPPECAIARD